MAQVWTCQELKETPHLGSAPGPSDLGDTYFSQDPTFVIRPLPAPCSHLLPLKSR